MFIYTQYIDSFSVCVSVFFFFICVLCFFIFIKSKENAEDKRNEMKLVYFVGYMRLFLMYVEYFTA